MVFPSESEAPKSDGADTQHESPHGTATAKPAGAIHTQGGADGAQTHLHELGEDALAPGADLPIRLPTFEGPLDLLLFLIRRNEIDIYDIPIESVTRQYMQVLHSMEELNLEVAGDFFVMAATLMYIKSRMLLPTNEQVAQPQEEEEEVDPRWELVQQLLEYKKYKEAAFELQALVEHRQDFLERFYQQEEVSAVERELEPADRIELWNTFNKVLRRLSERIVKGEIQDEEISVSQSMEYILGTIKVRDSFRFTELLEGRRLTVAFLISTFLAILELTRLKRLYIVQDAVYGEIECLRRDDPEDQGEDISEAEREEAMAPRKAARERKAAALVARLAEKATASGAGNVIGAADTNTLENADFDDEENFDDTETFEDEEEGFEDDVESFNDSDDHSDENDSDNADTTKSFSDSVEDGGEDGDFEWDEDSEDEEEDFDWEEEEDEGSEDNEEPGEDEPQQ